MSNYNWSSFRLFKDYGMFEKNAIKKAVNLSKNVLVKDVNVVCKICII